MINDIIYNNIIIIVNNDKFLVFLIHVIKIKRKIKKKLLNCSFKTNNQELIKIICILKQDFKSTIIFRKKSNLCKGDENMVF